MMDKQFASSRLRTDKPSADLIRYLLEIEKDVKATDGVLYYDFPFFRDDTDTLYRSNVVLTSKSHGIVLFQTSGLDDPKNHIDEIATLDESLDQLYSLVFSKLLKSKSLRIARDRLAIAISSFLFFPDITAHDALDTKGFSSPVLYTYPSIREALLEIGREPVNDQAWDEMRSVLEGAKGILRPRPRVLRAGKPNGRARLLADLEAEVANFDREQRLAAIPIVEGPQRIRGLAGSGKTVVLAMKAALIHLRDPTARIVITFYTKSLYDFIKTLITKFYRQFNDFDPNWEQVSILHAWGGSQLDGVYSVACADAGVPTLTFKDARQAKHPFGYVCQKLIQTGKVQQKYDYVLIDEAQDFPESFFGLCFQLAKGPELDRNVIWAYDELQSILDVSVLNPRQAFGANKTGDALVDLERAAGKSGFGLDHDIVLRKCYRNAREILVCAHALGFGIYSDHIVQMLEDNEHWKDVGYIVEAGNCIAGERQIVRRPRENSPLSISDHQTPDEMVVIRVFEEFSDELEWISREIRAFIDDGLEPADILVIALDDRNARNYFVELSAELAAHDIRTNNVLTNPYDYTDFFEEGEVTLSTVYRAKGNEAPVVFAVGIDALAMMRNHQRTRNKIFTAFTRAKAWLRISGLEGAQQFAGEIEHAMANFPNLDFEFPDVVRIHMIQRDLKDKTARLRKLKETVTRQLSDMGLDPEEQLELMLGTKEKR